MVNGTLTALTYRAKRWDEPTVGSSVLVVRRRNNAACNTEVHQSFQSCEYRPIWEFSIGLLVQTASTANGDADLRPVFIYARSTHVARQPLAKTRVQTHTNFMASPQISSTTLLQKLNDPITVTLLASAIETPIAEHFSISIIQLRELTLPVQQHNPGEVTELPQHIRQYRHLANTNDA
jgi:hypothetical protein